VHIYLYRQCQIITIFFLRPTHSLITFNWMSKMNSIQFLRIKNKAFCYSDFLICATTIGSKKSLFDDTPSSVVTLDHPGTDQSLSHKLIYYCCLCFCVASAFPYRQCTLCSRYLNTSHCTYFCQFRFPKPEILWIKFK
jgi:hypothetical protein